MKKLKLSPWHSGDVKPVHVGVYNSKWNDWYRYWDGCYWYNGSLDINIASSFKKRLKISAYQDWEWRGILK